MKRIKEYKKLFNIEGQIDLKELKTSYRNLVKEYHPDKFLDEAAKEEAEKISTRIIDGYHFLVSIAPETKESLLEQYATTINESGIVDYRHKGLLMEVTFDNGFTYEYFGVNDKLFQKFNNSDKQVRFAKKSIFNSFLYRKSKTVTPELV